MALEIVEIVTGYSPTNDRSVVVDAFPVPIKIAGSETAKLSVTTVVPPPPNVIVPAIFTLP